MLEPHGRTLLFDILKPPQDHVLDAAIATTFTLDLMALLTAPVAFSLFDVNDHNELLNQESLTLLESLRRYADKITVFCQAGQIGLPRAQFPQLEFLEQSIVACRSRIPGGVFHPKIWLLRYLTPAQLVTYRLACLTRNLTFDRCWDTVVTLEGPVLDRQRSIAANHPLGDFIAALPDVAVHGTTEAVRERVTLMAAEVRRVAFSPPEGFESFAFHPIGLASPPRAPFADRPGRMLMLSPFVSDGGLKRLTEGRDGSILVSRAESLENPRCQFPGVRRFYVLSSATHDEAEETNGDEIDLTRGLHAKCYVIDAGSKAHVFTGSANATEAAFENNVEFLVELVGPKSASGVDALFERGDGKTCFGDMLEEFAPQPRSINEDDERRRAVIERTRTAIASIKIIGSITSAADYFDLDVRFGDPIPIEPGVTVTCWPVTVGQGYAADVRNQATNVLFRRLSFEALTAFLAFQVTADVAGRPETFVVTVELQGAPADRRERLLRSVIKDRQRLLRFLMFLLADDAELADAMGTPAKKRHSHDAADVAHSNGALLESLLRTLHRTPERLDAVARLVEDLKQQPDCAELLPPNFEQIWEPVWAARQASKS